MRQQLKNDRLLVLVRKQPATVHRLAVAVEGVLAAVGGAVDGPRCEQFNVAELSMQPCNPDSWTA